MIEHGAEEIENKIPHYLSFDRKFRSGGGFVMIVFLVYQAFDEWGITFRYIGGQTGKNRCIYRPVFVIVVYGF